MSELSQSIGLRVAILITLIAVPVLLILDRQRPDAAAPPVTVGGIQPDQVLGTAPLPFDAITIPPNGDEPPVIVVPDIPEGVQLRATYSSTIESPRKCAIGSVDVPVGLDVTVRNVNNDRSIRCTNSITPTVDQEGLVVLPFLAYVKIADVTDSPVPVEITW